MLVVGKKVEESAWIRDTINGYRGEVNASSASCFPKSEQYLETALNADFV
jgi:hypothetical protein